MHKYRWNFDRSLLFAPENRDNGAPTDDPPADNPPTGDEPGTPNGNEDSDKKFTQAELDRIVQERLDRDRRKREADADAAKKEAERKALKDKEEYKTLTETQEKELGELRPTKKRFDELAELVTKQLETEVNGWPEEVKALLPDSEPVDVLVFLQAVERARPLAAKLMAPPPEEPPKSPTGNNRGPKPSGAVRDRREITPVVDVKRTF